MSELTKKHKTHSLTIYHRGIELVVLCVTTSKKRFAEILGESVSQINKYGCAYDLRYPICNENPEKLFAKVGLGGEGRYILERDDIKTLEEMKEIINEHRKTYTTYRDYLEKTGQ